MGEMLLLRLNSDALFSIISMFQEDVPQKKVRQRGGDEPHVNQQRSQAESQKTLHGNAAIQKN